MTDIDLRRRVHDRTAVEDIARRYRTWERWGSGDELGAANLVTPESVARAAALITTGKTFSLAMPLDRRTPTREAHPRISPQHYMIRVPQDPMPFDDDGLQRFTDDAVVMPLQASTQWDAFCHVFHDGVTYNGQTYDSITATQGALRNSITNIKDRAIGRGVLLDVARFRGRDYLEDGEAIQSEDLEACAAAQGVDVRQGDFVLVRTGQMERRIAAGSWGDYAGGSAPGLGVDAAHFLCGRDVVAVATDTWGIEVIPYETADLMAPLHVILLVNAGIYIGEMWDLSALAADCAADGCYEFFLSAPPLTITGSVGSPLNPLAIK